MAKNSSSNRSFRIMVAAQLGWLVLVCLMVSWWGRLLYRQAARIAELEESVGLSVNPSQVHWHPIQRMLFWESLTFFALLLVSSVFLFWLYWRDLKRSRGLQAFFASVTHELRTPLTSIRLQAESLAEQCLPCDSIRICQPDVSSGATSQDPLIQRLLEDTIRLEAQVERTLELARVEGGGPVYTQAVQLKPWLNRFIKQWNSNFKDRMKFELSIQDVLIEADPNALQVIFKNLLENSLKHAQVNLETNSKTHSAEHSKKDPVLITIQSQSSEQGVTLNVWDNGPGYEGNPKLLGEIFHKGSRSQGTGVGLYLIKVLMSKMGGWVSFGVYNLSGSDSRTGFGVSLWFREGASNASDG